MFSASESRSMTLHHHHHHHNSTELRGFFIFTVECQGSV
jgi:hypothetical protein